MLHTLDKYRRSSRNATFAALIIIAGVAAYNWLIVPHRVYLYAAQRYETVVKDVAKKCEVLARKVDSKREKLQQLKRAYEKLRSKVFIPDRVGKFAGDLQAMSEKAGCVVYSLNVVTEKKKTTRPKKGKRTDINADTLQLNVVGSFRNILDLIRQLQSHSGKVWIDSVKMEIANRGSSQLRCDMAITIYSIIDKEIILNE